MLQKDKQSEKSFRCTSCGKSFQTLQALNSHIHYLHKASKSRGNAPLPPSKNLQNDPHVQQLGRNLLLKEYECEIAKKDAELRNIESPRKQEEQSIKEQNEIQSLREEIRNCPRSCYARKRADEAYLLGTSAIDAVAAIDGRPEIRLLAEVLKQEAYDAVWKYKSRAQ